MNKKRNMAVFFQKYGDHFFVKVFRKIYSKCALNSNARRIAYLRDAGATIGKNCIIRDIAALGSEPYLVEIGDNTSFSSNVQIVTHDGSIARLYYMGLTDKKYDYFGKVKIGSNCFIGMNALILKNVTIGDSCIVGAGSVVTKSVPANSIVCGVPAKVIGTVAAFAEKNQAFFDDSVGMIPYQKRQFIENNMEKYEQKRKECEAPENN